MPLTRIDAKVNAAELIAKVLEWSRKDDRVLALALCGSHARGEARDDSDIDFCILTANPDALLRDRSWIVALASDAEIAGPVEDYNRVQSIRVFYGTTEAEYGVTDQAWAEPPIDPGTAAVINDGLKILYDPDGRLERATVYAASISA